MGRTVAATPLMGPKGGQDYPEQGSAFSSCCFGFRGFHLNSSLFLTLLAEPGALPSLLCCAQPWGGCSIPPASDHGTKAGWTH